MSEGTSECGFTSHDRVQRIRAALAQLGIVGLAGIVGIVLFLRAFVVLTGEVIERDTMVFLWLHPWASPELTVIASVVSALDSEFLAVLVGRIILVQLIKRNLGLAIQLLVAIAGVQVL